MNTTEINDSSWPLKYFFISAFPLVAATVFLPLIAVSDFRLVVRKSKITSTKNLLRWIWIFCTFILYITADSGTFSKDPTVSSNSGTLYTAVSGMNLAIALIEAYIISHHQGRLARIYRHIRGHIGWSCFWIVTVASLLIGLFWQIGVELFPYVVFFIIIIIISLLTYVECCLGLV
jgi:hypothetical protein